MSLQDIVKSLKINGRLEIFGCEYDILQHIVWYQCITKEPYDKYVLRDMNGNDKYRFYIAGDLMGLAEIFEHEFKEPMPKILEYDNKKYRLQIGEFCEAIEVEGAEYYRKGDCEIWWDYGCLDNDGTGLSLGRNWKTWGREDLKVKYIKPCDIKV